MGKNRARFPWGQARYWYCLRDKGKTSYSSPGLVSHARRVLSESTKLAKVLGGKVGCSPTRLYQTPPLSVPAPRVCLLLLLPLLAGKSTSLRGALRPTPRCAACCILRTSIPRPCLFSAITVIHRRADIAGWDREPRERLEKPPSTIDAWGAITSYADILPVRWIISYPSFDWIFLRQDYSFYSVYIVCHEVISKSQSFRFINFFFCYYGFFLRIVTSKIISRIWIIYL